MAHRCLILILCLIQCAWITAQEVYPDNMSDSDCATGVEALAWGIERGVESQPLSHMYAQPFIGDVDNDGESEVVTVGYDISPHYSSSIVIYGQNLQLKTSFTVPQMYVYGGYPIAVADVDRDGIAEIFVHGNDGHLRCYHPDGMLKWTSNALTGLERSPSLIVADVNGDGTPEIWSLDKIYNAVTGKLLVSVPEIIGCSLLFMGGESVRGRAAMPVFADFDNDGILELAGGNKVYKIGITNTNGTSGNSVVLWKTITGNGAGDGLTSVADIDLDGYLDVVVVQSGQMYVWKPYYGSTSFPVAIAFCPYSAPTSGSRALLADVDNDGYTEILFTYVTNIAAYKYVSATQGLQQMWQKSTTDLSGATTMTAFDFNQDGFVEIVYRDETDLRIIDGTTGNNISTFACLAPTAVDYPVIVDLDRDGQAEMVASYNTYNTNEDKHAKLQVFRSPANVTWAPARYVWNQHGYNVVNVNNDLTVPVVNFNPATTFVDPQGVVRRPFNNFLQQATMLDMYGRPFVPLANATMTNDTSVLFENSEMVITYRFCNTGSLVLNSPFTITYYANAHQETVIHTETVNTPLQADDCMYITVRFTAAELAAHPNLDSIVVAVNDNGNGIAQLGGQQEECDLTDNIMSFSINPCPIRQSTVLADICLGESYVDENFNISAEDIPEAREYHFFRRIQIGDCDSVVQLKLRVHAVLHHQIVETISQGADYNQHGLFIPQEMLSDVTRIDTSVVLESVYGCDSVLDITLYIAFPEVELYLPNAITANKDGENDVFSIPEWVQSQIADFEIHIFNRWGEIVYYSPDKNFRWDGHVSANGSVYHSIVYVYIIRYTDLKGKKYVRKGTITVL